MTSRFASSPRHSMSSGDHVADTPLHNRRSTRLSNVHAPEDEAQPLSGSPTSTLSGDSTSNTHNRLNDSLSSFQRMMSTPMNLGTPVRKVVIRSDQALVTCFDPVDKELYDLWVPKQ